VQGAYRALTAQGGSLVGAPLSGKRVLVLDDVITAGTAIRGACDHIDEAGGHLLGVVELLDRQERGAAEGATASAVQEIERERNVPVRAVMTLSNILAFARSRPELADHLDRLEACQSRRCRVADLDRSARIRRRVECMGRHTRDCSDAWADAARCFDASSRAPTRSRLVVSASRSCASRMNASDVVRSADVVDEDASRPR